MWNKCGRGARLAIVEVYEVKTGVERLRWGATSNQWRAVMFASNKAQNKNAKQREWE